ncbi:MAG: sulfotransferase domain-containing protein [Sphingobacteriaceae bacterium]|nr:sulfotransferase domain-containing protein [Sphingobacteriaceae bacterium]
MLPNLLICGTNKAGTSSLYTYLNYHPKIFGSAVKETCYYLPLVFKSTKEPLSHYAKFFAAATKKHQYRFEATPGYFYGGEHVAKTIQSELGNVKIILLFREPSQRAFSFFKHLKGKFILNSTADFNQLVEQQLTSREFDTTYLNENQYAARMLRDGFYDRLFLEWISVYGKENVYVGFLENFETNPKKELLAICNWLKLDDRIYENYPFQIDNKSIIYQNSNFHKLALFIYKKFEVFFRKNKTITQKLRDVYQKLNKNIGSDKMHPSTQQKLAELYKPSISNFKQNLIHYNYSNLPSWLINHQ